MSDTVLQCRSCGAPLPDTFVDLGMSPLSNSYLRAEDLDSAETFYPLHARVCRICFLVQLPVQIFELLVRMIVGQIGQLGPDLAHREAFVAPGLFAK